MKKIKKIFKCIALFVLGICTKVSAAETDLFEFIETKYGVIEPKYGVIDPEPVVVEPTGFRIGKVALPIVFFVIGLVVILSKKITKKIKAIIVSGLVIIGILSLILMYDIPRKYAICGKFFERSLETNKMVYYPNYNICYRCGHFF